MSGTFPVSLVCCDLAGTIVSDGSILEKAFAEAIATQGVVPGTAAYARSMVMVDRSGGLPPRDVMRALFAENDAQAQRPTCPSSALTGPWGTGSALRPCPERWTSSPSCPARTSRCASVSGFSRSVSRLVFDRLGISRRADLVLCLDDAPRGCPWPDPVLTAVIRLGIGDVAEVAVVGDSENVITAGRRAGARTLVGLPGTRSAQRLHSAGATHLITSITELPDLLL